MLPKNPKHHDLKNLLICTSESRGLHVTDLSSHLIVNWLVACKLTKIETLMSSMS